MLIDLHYYPTVIISINVCRRLQTPSLGLGSNCQSKISCELWKILVKDQKTLVWDETLVLNDSNLYSNNNVAT